MSSDNEDYDLNYGIDDEYGTVFGNESGDEDDDRRYLDEEEEG